MQRYLIKQEQIKNNIIIMNEDDSYHIGKVMRMNVGEFVDSKFHPHFSSFNT